MKTQALIAKLIAYIDQLLTAQVNAIMHHPQFKQLEASWRGVQYLVTCNGDMTNVKIKLLDVSWHELSKDLARAIEFDQSATFSKIYSNEFDMPGGEPFGLLVGDYEPDFINHTAGIDSIDSARNIAKVAACAFVPFVMGVKPTFFGIESFSELHTYIDLKRMFAHRQYARWKALCVNEDSRFLAVVLPKFLVRLPYSTHNPTQTSFVYREISDADPMENYLFANASYGFAAVVMRSFIENGWFARICGTEANKVTGGVVDKLPRPDFYLDMAAKFTKHSLQISLTELQQQALRGLGFITLCECKFTPFAAFFSAPSIQRPAQYEKMSANNNANLMAQIPYTLCVSRFAHFVKVIMRDKMGSFIELEILQTMLQNWLANYVGTADSDSDLAARYPLSEAKVRIWELQTKPGYYQCTVYLKPQYQLKRIETTLKIVSKNIGQA